MYKSVFVVFDDKLKYSIFLIKNLTFMSPQIRGTYIHYICEKNIMLKDIKTFASIKYYIYLCSTNNNNNLKNIQL